MSSTLAAPVSIAPRVPSPGIGQLYLVTEPTPPLFAGIEFWPDLDHIFRTKALSLIAQEGIGAFFLEAGKLSSDGRPTFGSPSRIALQIVAEIAEHFAGFHFVDVAGVPWYVAPEEGRPGRPGCWRAVALGGEMLPYCLSDAVRTEHLASVTEQLAVLRSPGQSTTAAAYRERCSLARLHRRLTLLSIAVDLLPALYGISTANRSGALQVRAVALAEVCWGGDSMFWPDDWAVTVFDAIAMLGGISARVLRLPKSGWCPQSLSHRPALTNVCWHGPEILSIRLAPPFLRFVGHWLAWDVERRPMSPYSQQTIPVEAC